MKTLAIVHPLFAALLLAGAVPVAAVAAADPQNTSAAPAAKGSSERSAQGEATALGLLSALNTHEIAAARQAEAKGVNGEVLDYARLMIREHGENQEKTLALGTAATTAEVQAFQRKGEADLKKLNRKSGQEYEKAYIQAMVKGHAEALKMIDEKMMPAARSAAVEAHLTQTRMHVEQHLDKAKALAGRS